MPLLAAGLLLLSAPLSRLTAPLPRQRRRPYLPLLCLVTALLVGLLPALLAGRWRSALPATGSLPASLTGLVLAWLLSGALSPLVLGRVLPTGLALAPLGGSLGRLSRLLTLTWLSTLLGSALLAADGLPASLSALSGVRAGLARSLSRRRSPLLAGRLPTLWGSLLALLLARLLWWTLRRLLAVLLSGASLEALGRLSLLWLWGLL